MNWLSEAIAILFEILLIEGRRRCRRSSAAQLTTEVTARGLISTARELTLSRRMLRSQSVTPKRVRPFTGSGTDRATRSGGPAAGGAPRVAAPTRGAVGN